MVVAVSGSTSDGKPLAPEKLTKVIEACDMALSLDETKNKLLMYVETRMSFIAPNLTNICGSVVAAKIIGVAGGLTALSRMPACNVLVLGAAKKTLQGFSAQLMKAHRVTSHENQHLLELTVYRGEVGIRLSYRHCPRDPARLPEKGRQIYCRQVSCKTEHKKLTNDGEKKTKQKKKTDARSRLV